MAELLLRLGANPTLLDTEFHAPAAGWAAHGGHHELAARLAAAAGAWAAS